jgi:hypothetical protein
MLPSLVRPIPIAVCSTCDRPLDVQAHDPASEQHAACALAAVLGWCQTLLAHSTAKLVADGAPDLAALREVTSLLGTATESYERVCKAVPR